MDSEMYTQARLAVIEKWLTLLKMQFLDECMDHRVKLINARLNSKEMCWFKVKLSLKRQSSIEQFKFLEPSGLLTKNYSRLGSRVDYLFPLLDPAFSLKESVLKHNADDGPTFVTQLSQQGNREPFFARKNSLAIDETRFAELEALVEGFPVVMPFIPT
jgi:hypothetical protein